MSEFAESVKEEQQRERVFLKKQLAEFEASGDRAAQAWRDAPAGSNKSMIAMHGMNADGEAETCRRHLRQQKENYPFLDE